MGEDQPVLDQLNIRKTDISRPNAIRPSGKKYIRPTRNYAKWWLAPGVITLTGYKTKWGVDQMGLV